MPEPTTGTRGTKFVGGTENLIIRDVAAKIHLLEPEAAPLITFMNQLKTKKRTGSPKYEWITDELLPDVVVVDNAAGTGTTVNVAAGTGVRVRVNDLLSDPRSGEVMQVTAIATDSLTVVRSKGDIAAGSLAVGDELIVIGTAMIEGGTPPTVKTSQKTTAYNYIQSFKDAYSLTEILNASDTYGEKDRTYQRAKLAIEHKKSIEKAFLVGDRFEDTSGTQTVRGTGGLINTITTNVLDFSSGPISEQDFDSFSRDMFRYGTDRRILLASPIFISAVNSWARARMQTTAMQSTYGMRLMTWETAHGTFKMIRHWFLKNFTELQKYVFALEPANLAYRFMDGLDTRLVANTQANDSSSIQDEYRTACGVQVIQDKTHGIAKGITGYAP